MRRNVRLRNVAVAVGAAALLLGGCAKEREPAHGSSDIRLRTFAASSATAVEVATSSGHVRVRGEVGVDSIRVTITLHNRGGSLDQAEAQVKRMVVDASQAGDRVSLRYNAQEQAEDVREHGSVDFDVVMPLVGNLSAAVGDGTIGVGGIDGAIRLEAADGEILASAITGTLDARTGNGPIDIDAAEGALHLRSANGRLSMTRIVGSVDAETANGDIRFRGRLIGAAHRMRTTGGDIDIGFPAELSLTIDARASGGIEAHDLSLDGDTEGREWRATLNPPASATLELYASAGRIDMWIAR